MEKELNYLSEKIAELGRQRDARIDLVNKTNNNWPVINIQIKLLEEEVDLLHSILSAVNYFELGSDC
jgi:hypothetical protein